MAGISVIIPIYNVEKYLRECLDSILNQSYNDLEIICVNDGSTDSSFDILNEYALNDQRFVIINQDNLGVSVARNKGVEKAQGKYIAFIDSDDYLPSEDYFEKLFFACEKYSADIAVAGIIRGNKKKSSYLLKIEKEEVCSDYYSKLKICDVPESNYVWNKLYKRSSLIKTGLKFPPGRIYEDICYTNKILYYTDILVSVPGIYYFYRKRRGSIVKDKSKRYADDYKTAESEMYTFFKEHNIDVSNLRNFEKKYKIFGLTIFKTQRKRDICRCILFNCIKWKIKVENK